MSKDIFDKERLTPALDSFLRDVNPWWERKPGPVLPAYKRWAFNITLSKFQKGLAPVIVIRGPRQVGKTTLQLQIIEDLIENKGIPSNHILRIQFDEIPSLRGLQEPILSISRWFENRVLGCTFNEAARSRQPDRKSVV